MRESVNDAMDVHAGKAVIDGPMNYLGAVYRSVPVGITVEGANILTRSLMIFGQGAIRSHPYLLKEILALGDANRERGLDDFDQQFWKHVVHSVATAVRAAGRSWSGGYLTPVPNAGRATPFYAKMGQYSAAFALTSDIAFLTIGGALKRMEILSGRLGDILSELYFLSAALKRFEDEGRQADDFPLLDYVMKTGFAKIEQTFDMVFANMPNPVVGALLKAAILPLGPLARGPSDRTVRQCADLITAPCATRDRLVEGLFVGGKEEAVGGLIDAFEQVIATQPIHDRLRKLHIRDWRTAEKKGMLTPGEVEALKSADAAIAKVIAVDDFSLEELVHRSAAPAQSPVAAKPEKAKTVAKALAESSEPQPNIEPQPTAVLH
jgi:acyl-CoA dehydrogenase